MEGIKDLIETEIDGFKKNKITVVEGFDFNQYERIRKNYRLYHSKYKNGKFEKDDKGNNIFRKYYFNETRNPCNTATKEIDWDVKDIEINGRGPNDRYKAWFFQKDLEIWMAKNNFANLINRTVLNIPKIGSQVWKFIENEPYLVDMRNFFVDPSADCLDEASYIIERHFYNPRIFLKKSKEFNFDEGAVEEVKEKIKEKDNPKIILYERYGTIDDDYKKVYFAKVKDEMNSVVKGSEFVLDDNDETDGKVLKEEEIDKHPYEEFHFEKIEGRWLGVSIPEIVEDAQIRLNELVNMKVKASYWAALQLFQSEDGTLEDNLLEDVRNGTIVQTLGTIQPIPTEERNLSAYTQEEERWMNNIKTNTFSYGGTRGEPLPARTPLGSKELSVGLTSAHFDQIRDSIASTFKRILIERILPSFKKSNSSEHVIKITDDIDDLQNMVFKHKSSADLIEMINRNNGRLPTVEERDISEQVLSKQIREQEEVTFKIPEDFYEDLDYDISVIITGEEEDVSAQNANLQAILQLVGSNPAVLQQEPMKSIIEQIADKSGVDIANIQNSSELKRLEPEGQQMGGQQVQRGGGGVSRPSIPQAPQREQLTRRI